MDDTTFKLLTSFIVRARKISGAINAKKLLEDKAYAEEVFKQIDSDGDEDLIMLSLQLREKLGLLNDPKTSLSGPTDLDPDDPEGTRKIKYKLGARG